MLADWLIPFEKKATYNEKFTQIDGESVDTQMMHMVKNLNYITTESWHAVSLDYVGNKIAMAFVLPHENNNFSEFETSFSQDDYENLVRNLNGTNIDLTLPKFKLEWGSKSLMQSLNSLGMKKVFIGDANHFPKLLEQNGEPLTQSLWIDNVYHQCKVIVDEKGTEAAAATSISVSIESAPTDPENPIEFKVDRPAMFFIYQKSTGALLFIGRLTKL
ncbi:MAG: serpin family protein [Bdellovibrionota bacterium]